MNEKLFIPKKIKVGYNERKDTYTQKLAYVIYYDDKGVLRKETSWESWRNKKLDFNDYDNVPTEGFVLNKGVGGQRQSNGWNARNEYIRVYDPRGFEFEISVSNLLFILQECTSTKGKGLEGEFVYSWSGKELVLLPVATQDYKASNEFTSLQTNKISAKDLKVGCSYLTKQMNNLVYIGRFPFLATIYSRNNYAYELSESKGHIFYDESNEKSPFQLLKAMGTLASLNSDTPVSNYADIMDKYNNTKHASKATDIIATEVTFNFYEKLKSINSNNIYQRHSVDTFIKIDDKFVRIEIRPEYNVRYEEGERVNDYDFSKVQINQNYTIYIKDNNVRVSHNNRNTIKGLKSCDDNIWNTRYKTEDVALLTFYDVKVKTETGLVDPDKYNG